MTDPKLNPNLSIEEAIGERVKDPKAQKKFTKAFQAEPIPLSNSHPSEIPDEMSPNEMLDLEELNRQTEERFRDPDSEIPNPTGPESKVKAKTPASKSVPPPETKVCSPESPPQTNKETAPLDNHKFGTEKLVEYLESHPQTHDGVKGTAPTVSAVRDFTKKNPELFPPAEDYELTALRNFIMDSGFTPSGVAMHIVALCSQPMLTPTTTTWDFKDWASIPDMVFALLRQPGYLEGIWPSLKVVMSSNKGNASWTAGIATSIAYFDVIRTLPTLKEMSNEKKS